MACVLKQPIRKTRGAQDRARVPNLAHHEFENGTQVIFYIIRVYIVIIEICSHVRFSNYHNPFKAKYLNLDATQTPFFIQSPKAAFFPHIKRMFL